MPIPRSRIVDPEAPGVYHCISRCVRRARLCGGAYEHRREWIADRLRQLSSVFAIDVVSFTVLSNHMHLLVWTDPERAAGWSASEVAARWLELFPKAAPPAATSLDEAIEMLAADSPKIEMLRKRLRDLSWFMKCLKEPIARRANEEDDCTGAFWEGRFKCYAVTDDAGALTCSVYIDLNPIRAGVASTPEESDFTSVQERIRHYRRSARGPGEAAADDLWLSPIGGQSDQPGRRVLLEIDVEAYFEIVDSVGRAARGDTAGRIPSQLRPILERLDMEWDTWVNAVGKSARRLWGTTVGAVSSLAAEAARRGQKRVVNPFAALG